LGKCGRFHYVPFPGKKKLKEKVEKEKEALEATRVVSTAWSRLRDMEVSTDFGWIEVKKKASR